MEVHIFPATACGQKRRRPPEGGLPECDPKTPSTGHRITLWWRRWDSNPRSQAYEAYEDDQTPLPRFGKSISDITRSHGPHDSGESSIEGTPRPIVHRVNIEAATEAATKVKSHLVRTHGIGEDLTPMLELWSNGAFIGVVTLTQGDASRVMHEIAVSIVAHQPDEVLMIAETYFAEAEDADTIGPDVTPADFVARFAAHDHRVRAALTLASFNRSGPLTYRYVPYRHEGRTVVYDEPLDVAPEDQRAVGGDYEDLITIAFERANELDDRSEAIRRFKEFGLELWSVRPPTTRERNAPCWCGSGLKFKRCHGALHQG